MGLANPTALRTCPFGLASVWEASAAVAAIAVTGRSIGASAAVAAAMATGWAAAVLAMAPAVAPTADATAPAVRTLLEPMTAALAAPRFPEPDMRAVSKRPRSVAFVSASMPSKRAVLRGSARSTSASAFMRALTVGSAIMDATLAFSSSPDRPCDTYRVVSLFWAMAAARASAVSA